jgi:hypothetical protein
MLGTTAFGFAAPGVIVWRLHKNNWKFGLRALFVTMTVVAAFAAICAYTLSL